VNGNASSRCDYTRTIGTLQFAAGETLKTIVVPFTDDAYAEGTKRLRSVLPMPAERFSAHRTSLRLPSPTTKLQRGRIPIDSGRLLCSSALHRFSRAASQTRPDFNSGKTRFSRAAQTLQCIEARRINVSASFFLSIEFQETGYFTERTYKAAYGNGLSSSTLGGLHLISVPIIRLNEFLPDSQAIAQGVIVGQGNWQQKLDDNKNAYYRRVCSAGSVSLLFSSVTDPRPNLSIS
jgi:hypothetical protein